MARLHIDVGYEQKSSCMCSKAVLKVHHTSLSPTTTLPSTKEQKRQSLAGNPRREKAYPKFPPIRPCRHASRERVSRPCVSLPKPIRAIPSHAMRPDEQSNRKRTEAPNKKLDALASDVGTKEQR